MQVVIYLLKIINIIEQELGLEHLINTIQSYDDLTMFYYHVHNVLN
jgi:hypothetical protein